VKNSVLTPLFQEKSNNFLVGIIFVTQNSFLRWEEDLTVKLHRVFTSQQGALASEQAL